MKFKFLSVLIICLMMFSTVGVASAASPLFVNNVNDGSSGGIVVNDLTIDGLQKAINNATDGDTIIINGSIDEKGTVNCNNNLLIIGQNDCNLTNVHWSCNKDIEFRCINFCDYYFSGNGGVIKGKFSVVINNCSFVNNRLVEDSASSNSGGVIYASGSVNVSNSTFTGNFAPSSGGAIYACGGISVSGSSFDGNKASDGGAIYGCTSIDISNSNFTGNYGDENGGAIYSCKYAANILNSEFVKNSAYKYGGAIYSQNGVKVNDSSFSSNSVQGAVVNCEGGAICSYGDKVILSNSTFVRNDVEDYGGAVWSDKDIGISSCSFNDNIAGDDEGGAVYCDDGSVTITDSIFNHNTAKTKGGAIWCDDVITVDNSSFNNNRADGASVMQCEGGAICASGSVSISKQPVTLTNCSFVNNFAYDYGGAVWSDDGIKVYGCLFKNNSVKDNRGGAIYMDESCSLDVSYSSFYGNHANEKGGAIYCEGNLATIDLDSHNSFENNTAKEGSVAFTDGIFNTVYSNWWGTPNPNWDSGLLVQWRCWPIPNVIYEDNNPLSYNPNL